MAILGDEQTEKKEKEKKMMRRKEMEKMIDTVEN